MDAHPVRFPRTFITFPGTLTQTTRHECMDEMRTRKLVGGGEDLSCLNRNVDVSVKTDAVKGRGVE